MLGKTEGKRKGMTEDEIVRWHHQFSGHEHGQNPVDGEGKGSLVQSMGLQEVRHGEQQN